MAPQILQRLLHFDLRDVELNRKGEMARLQRLRLLGFALAHATVAILMLFVAGFIAWGIVHVGGGLLHGQLLASLRILWTGPPLILITLVLAIVFAVRTWKFIMDIRGGRVEHSYGHMTLKYASGTPGSPVRSPRGLVGDHCLRLPVVTLRGLPAEVLCQVYFTVNTDQFLSLEVFDRP